MNKIEVIKQEQDGLDVLPEIRRCASDPARAEGISDGDLVRMKWYGVFHRQLTPGFFMMRLRTPGGRLTAEQLRTIAGIARDYGRGLADLTTRQNIQLRWLTMDVLPAVWERLDRAGITSLQSGMDNVRNFIGCPLAGIDASEIIDTTPLIAAMGAVYLGNREYSNLPRKFNVSLAGCSEDCGHAQTQDLGFLPARRNVGGGPTAGFNVLVGGALGGTSPRLATPLGVFVPPAQVVPLFAALLRVYRDHGPREQRTKARLKWLIADWGTEKLRHAVARELGHPLLSPGVDAVTHAAGDHLGVHRERQAGLHYVGLHVPVGRVSADQLEELSHLAARYGRGDIRLTIGQNAIITGVAEHRLGALLRQPLLQELWPDPAPVWRNLVACTGSDYCHFSLIDTKARAVELAAEVERRGVEVPEGTRIHLSGCVHACGKHHIADIGLQGASVRIGDRVEEAADVYTGGRLGPDARLAARQADKVPMREMADVLVALIEQHRGSGFEEAADQDGDERIAVDGK